MGVQFSEADYAEMRKFYEAELVTTMSKYRHLKSILEKLGSHVPELPADRIVPVQAASTPSSSAKASKASAPVRRKRKGKRGRKSIWGEFILRSLKKLDRPMLYSEIVRSAQIEFNIKDEKMKELKAAINQSAFRLRTVHGKIETIGEPGKKEKHIALKSWYGPKGKLLPEYAKKVTS